MCTRFEKMIGIVASLKDYQNLREENCIHAKPHLIFTPLKDHQRLSKTLLKGSKPHKASRKNVRTSQRVASNDSLTLKTSEDSQTLLKTFKDPFVLYTMRSKYASPIIWLILNESTEIEYIRNHYLLLLDARPRTPLLFNDCDEPPLSLLH